jgi:hypothetical protein
VAAAINIQNGAGQSASGGLSSLIPTGSSPSTATRSRWSVPKVARSSRRVLRRQPRARGGLARSRGVEARAVGAEPTRRRQPAATARGLRHATRGTRCRGRPRRRGRVLPDHGGRPAGRVPGVDARLADVGGNGAGRPHARLRRQVVDGFKLDADRVARVAAPTRVMDGGQTPRMSRGAEALADALPDGTHCGLEGQERGPDPDVVAPVLIDFFAAA